MTAPQTPPPVETPRPLTRGELRRQRARQEFTADMSARWRAETQLLRANQQDRNNAVDAGQVRARDGWGDLPHLLLSILTGGLWLPVWFWVLLRNSRRVSRTGPGQRARDRRRATEADLRAQRRRRRATR